MAVPCSITPTLVSRTHQPVWHTGGTGAQGRGALPWRAHPAVLPADPSGVAAALLHRRCLRGHPWLGTGSQGHCPSAAGWMRKTGLGGQSRGSGLIHPTRSQRCQRVRLVVPMMQRSSPKPHLVQLSPQGLHAQHQLVLQKGEPGRGRKRASDREGGQEWGKQGGQETGINPEDHPCCLTSAESLFAPDSAATVGMIQLSLFFLF